MATMVAGLKSLEAKVDRLLLDTTNLAANQKVKAKTFADAAANAAASNQTSDLARTNEGKVKKPTVKPPSKAQYLTLTQATLSKANFVKLRSDAEDLSSRASSAIRQAVSKGSNPINSTAPIWRITCNTFTREIQLQLRDQALLKAVLSLPSDAWVNNIYPALQLKHKIYPVIVHGIPTTFDTANPGHTQALINENHGVLDSATRMIWANKFSIQLGKPFSSIIIYLTDPDAADQVICNQFCFRHLLKVTEKSTERAK